MNKKNVLYLIPIWFCVTKPQLTKLLVISKYEICFINLYTQRTDMN
jgi:hypothetical protein